MATLIDKHNHKSSVFTEHKDQYIDFYGTASSDWLEPVSDLPYLEVVKAIGAIFAFCPIVQPKQLIALRKFIYPEEPKDVAVLVATEILHSLIPPRTYKATSLYGDIVKETLLAMGCTLFVNHTVAKELHITDFFIQAREAARSSIAHLDPDTLVTIHFVLEPNFKQLFLDICPNFSN